MAALTKLESKIAEVLGLAMAARVVGTKVRGMLEADATSLAETLKQMEADARETQQRCTAVAATFDRKKSSIVTAAKETRDEAVEMMETYLEGDDEALDGFEFLTMSTAGELGHWLVVAKLNQRAANTQVTELTEWALPIQQRHFQEVLDGAATLAGDEDPLELEE